MAISADCIWEVQVGASDLNGGGFKAGATGTDRTYPTSNPQAIGDLKTDGATLTVMVSATYTFVASDVGNVVSVNVTDSGGLATVGRYEVTSVTGGKATVDRAWATANNTGTAGATAVLGGALATPGQAGKTLQTSAEGVAYQTVWVKSGTYTLTTDAKQSGGPFYSTVSGIRVNGYQTTRGDKGTSPVLEAGAITSVNLWEIGTPSNSGFYNLSADGSNGASNVGFKIAYAYHRIFACSAVNCVIGFSSSSGGLAVSCGAIDCVKGFSALTNCYACFAIGSTEAGFSACSYAVICLAATCGTGFLSNSVMFGCTADDCTSYGFRNTSNRSQFVSCLASNHSGVGAVGFSITGAGTRLENCGGYNNATHYSGFQDVFDFTSLTADPYVSQATGDFRPNDTAGGGAELRAAGTGVYGQTDNRDIGAVQHTDSGGGYTYGDEDPDQVLTTADGAGNYVPIADSDTVDGGVSYGAGEEGTGVNQATIEGILDARGITTDNIALTNQPLDATATEAAAAAAIAASDTAAKVADIHGMSEDV